MREYTRQSKLIANDTLKMLKEQTVMAIAESLGDNYVNDRHKVILKQAELIENFVIAIDTDLSFEESEDLETVRDLCKSIRPFSRGDSEVILGLLEEAVDLCKFINLDIFSELQATVTEVALNYDLSDFEERYDELLVSVDKLGLRSGCNSILSENTLEYLIEFCDGPDIGKSRVVNILNNLKDNYVFSGDLAQKYIDKLDKIQKSKMDLF